jgi:hypothetical protein
MSGWEDVLDAYVEGRASRADAEGLLMRINLSADQREEIERSLRVADQVTAALKGAPPVTGMEMRLREALMGCGAPERVPGWLKADGTFAPRAEEGAEDLLDAVVEGRVSVEQLRAMRDAGRLDEDAREALEEMEMTAAEIQGFCAAAEAAPPAGMGERLGESLRGHMVSEAGRVDESVAARLIEGAKPRKRELGMPDARAASAGDEDEDEDEDDPQSGV